jgi:hypothetical protein
MSRSSEACSIISGRHVRIGTQPFRLADRNGHGTPTVSLLREGGEIREIHIRCGCGQEIILDCEYAHDAR